MHEWQKFRRESESVPPYSDLLKFLELEARGAKSTVEGSERRHSFVMPSKSSLQARTTYATRADNSCMVCGATRHHLYTCKKFRLLSSEQRKEVVRHMKQMLFLRPQPGGQLPPRTN